MSATPTAEKTFFGHPRGLSTLFFTEMWERLSYYGMRAFLVLFMVDAARGGMGMGDQTANNIYGIYTAGVYLVALPGGWLADKLLGLRRSVFIGGVIIMLGHFALAVPSTMFFYLGLALVVIGTGFLKPNVSAMVGKLYEGQSGAQRDAGFSLYYMGINIGAFAGPLICGGLAERVSWHVGFGAAGVGMALGLVQYVYGTKHFQGKGEFEGDPAERGKTMMTLAVSTVLLVIAAGVVYYLSSTGAMSLVQFVDSLGLVIVIIAAIFFAVAMLFGAKNADERKRIFVIMLLFIGAAMFWSGFEQAGSSMNLFTERLTERTFSWMTWGLVTAVIGVLTIGLLFGRTSPNKDVNVVLTVLRYSGGALIVIGLALAFLKGGTWEMPTSWLQSINPMFIIILAPVVGSLWVTLGERNPSLGAKFGWGLALLGIGFLVAAWGATYTEPGKVLPTWLVVTYFFHTVGELALSPVGLSAITKLSPQRLVGQMMGTWFMGAALGNLVAGRVAGLIESLPTKQIFFTVALIAIGAGIFFFALAIPIRKMVGRVE